MGGQTWKGQPKIWHGVRPLLWWLLLVAILFSFRLNQRLLEQTRLYFSISSPYSATVTLDGKPVESGERISLGKHHFTITGNQIDPVAQDLFIWYGRHDLDKIQLKRSTGTLSVSATPPAQSISISGPEFSTNLENSVGATFIVPTGSYAVRVQYRHWNDSQTVSVTRDASVPVNFTPRFGELHLSANYKDATFQLQDANGRQIESGDFPKLLTEIPVGSYQLLTSHHNHQTQKTVTVTANTTNDTVVEFQYGKAVIESSPSGAAVYGSDNSYWGQTPLELSELIPQTLHFRIELNGYQTASATLDVTANQTSTFHTNLFSFNYLNAMRDARAFMVQSNYQQALEAINQAITNRPNDAEATLLQKTIEVLNDIQQAEWWGSQSNYVNAIKFLDKVLAIEADNERAKAMLAHDKQLAPAQIERERVERLNRPHEAFNDAWKLYPGADLFDEHELTTSKPVKDVSIAIGLALKSGQPQFQLDSVTSPAPEIYLIEATYEIPGLLGAGTTSGRRTCVIVCGQAKDDETQIWFKVLEYKAKSAIPFSIGALLHTATTDHADYIPIHPSKIQMTDTLQAQLTNGVQNVTARIKQAVQ